MTGFDQSPFFGYQAWRNWYASARGGTGSIDGFEPTLFPIRDTKAFERRYRDQTITQITAAGESAEFTIIVPSNEAWNIHILQIVSNVIQRWILSQTNVPATFSVPNTTLARIKTAGGFPVPLIQNVRHDFVSTKDFFTVAPYFALPNTEFTVIPDATQGVDTSILAIRYELMPVPATHTRGAVLTSEAT